MIRAEELMTGFALFQRKTHQLDRGTMIMGHLFLTVLDAVYTYKTTPVRVVFILASRSLLTRVNFYKVRFNIIKFEKL